MSSLCGDCVFYEKKECKCNDDEPKRGCEHGISDGCTEGKQILSEREIKKSIGIALHKSCINCVKYKTNYCHWYDKDNLNNTCYLWAHFESEWGKKQAEEIERLKKEKEGLKHV